MLNKTVLLVLLVMCMLLAACDGDLNGRDSDLNDGKRDVYRVTFDVVCDEDLGVGAFVSDIGETKYLIVSVSMNETQYAEECP